MKARSVHAPARRLARTTISLGPDEGIAFGLRAVRYSPNPCEPAWSRADVLFCVSSHACTCKQHHCARIYKPLAYSQVLPSLSCPVQFRLPRLTMLETGPYTSMYSTLHIYLNPAEKTHVHLPWTHMCMHTPFKDPTDKCRND